MYKIISILFVITLINAAAPVEYNQASTKVWSDAATASVASAINAKNAAVGLTTAS